MNARQKQIGVTLISYLNGAGLIEPRCSRMKNLRNRPFLYLIADYYVSFIKNFVLFKMTVLLRNLFYVSFFKKTNLLAHIAHMNLNII